MKKVAISIFTFAFIFAAASESYACFCKPLWDTPLEKMVADSKDEADAVFVGKVISIRSADGDAETARRIIYVKLAVERSWKGATTNFIEVVTARDGAMCGFGFRVGKRFIVYADKGETDRLRTSSCSRTAMITRKSPDEKYLGKRQVRITNKK